MGIGASRTTRLPCNLVEMFLLACFMLCSPPITVFEIGVARTLLDEQFDNLYVATNTLGISHTYPPPSKAKTKNPNLATNRYSLPI